MAQAVNEKIVIPPPGKSEDNVMKKTSLLLLLLMLVTPAFSQLNWELIGTYPTYNDIKSSWMFNDSTMIIVGTAGLCMKTTDGGTTWLRGKINTTNELNGLCFPTPEYGYCFDSERNFYQSTDGGLSWSFRYFMNEYNPTAIAFKDSINGFWAIGSRLRRTSDGGNSWTTLPGLYGTLNCVKLVGSTLYAAVYRSYDFNRIYRSTNFGASWDTIYKDDYRKVMALDVNSRGDIFVGGTYFVARLIADSTQWEILHSPTYEISDIEFLDDTTVMVGGTGAHISRDLGTTFTHVQNGANLWQIETTGEVTFLTGRSGTIFKSTNKGYNWAVVNEMGYGVHYSACFLNRDTGFVSGMETRYGNGYNYIKRTTDGCRTWTDIPFPAGGIPAKGIYFLKNGTTGFLHRDREIMRTVDGGMTWTTVTAPLNANDTLRKFFFRDDLNGYIASFNQYYFKTTDGGLNWSREQINTTSSLMEFFFLNEQVGFVTRKNNIVAKTTDGGLTWSDKHFSSSGKALGINFVNDQYGFVYATENGGYTISQGEAWMYTGTWIPKMIDVDHYDNLNAVAIIWADPYPIAFHVGWTKDGETWTKHPLPLRRTDNAFITMADKTTGYIFASSNIIIKLTDPVFTSIEEDGNSLPGGFTLAQNYPNPFNPETVIRFALPTAGFAKGVVYDILGKEVATLVNGEMPAGEHRLSFNAANFPSGVYIFRLETGKNSAAIKMVLMR